MCVLEFKEYCVTVCDWYPLGLTYSPNLWPFVPLRNSKLWVGCVPCGLGMVHPLTWRQSQLCCTMPRGRGVQDSLRNLSTASKSSTDLEDWMGSDFRVDIAMMIKGANS